MSESGTASRQSLQAKAPRDTTRGSTPALYSFYCKRRDGAPISIEAAELVSDHAAVVWAQRVLQDHSTCDVVEVFERERYVAAVEASN